MVDATAALVLATVMLLLLGRRDELPLPATIAPPSVGVEVAAGSPGAETSGAEVFWTIVDPTAEIRIFNTTNVEQVAKVSFRLVPGPCSIDRTIRVTTPSEDRSIELTSRSFLDVSLADVVLPPLTFEVATVTQSGEACPPIGIDPREIFVQIHSLATQGSSSG